MATTLPPLPRLSAELAASTLGPMRSDAAFETEDDALTLGEDVVTPSLVRILLVSGLGSLCFGYDTGVVSGALLSIGTDLGGVELSAFDSEWIVSSALVGALIGALLAGRLADWFGRKPCILIGGALFALGAMEQAAASVYKEVILGRVLVGLAVGLASSVLPTYLSELSPPEFRGRIVASLVVLITGGQVLAYVVDAFFANVEHGWRYMFGLGAIPALVQLLLAFTLPESPRFQIGREKIAPARRTLKRLHPHASEQAVQHYIEVMQEDIEEDRQWGIDVSGGIGSVKEGLLAKLWRDKANRRAMILACGLQFFQQATGFNTVMYYSGKILVRAHFSHPAAFAILIAVSNFVCTIIALRLIDHIGRRPLLLYTLIGTTLGMFLTGLSFFYIPSLPPLPGAAPSSGAILALISMIIFCCAYALGLGNVPWVVQSEVFTNELRALGTGLATSTNWLANLFVAATFLRLSEAISPTGAFWLYGFVSILAWIFAYYCLPETKGLDLEETRALFQRDDDDDFLRAGYTAVGSAPSIGRRSEGDAEWGRPSVEL